MIREAKTPWRWILVGNGRVLAVSIPLVILGLSPIMRDWMLLLLLPPLMLVMLASMLRAWQWYRSPLRIPKLEIEAIHE
jgi:hypothetical protein